MPILVDKQDLLSKLNYATPNFTGGDFTFDSGGKWQFLSGLEKLSQIIRLELSTVQFTSIVLNTIRGNLAFKSMTENISNRDYALNRIRNDFQEALQRLKQSQSAITPPSETIGRIDSVDAIIDPDDPVHIIVTCKVTNILKQSVAVTMSVNSTEFSIKLIA